jgi:hypothetical protein
MTKSKNHLEEGETSAQVVDSVADILEHQTKATIKDWLRRVDADRHLITVPMDDKVRSCHLPQLFKELVHRLRYPIPMGERALVSRSAAKHGLTRCHQGYTAAMLVEESRMLQVSIFQTLQSHVHRVDSSLVLLP